ncbi:MAG TPA: hypothetical protein VJ110_02615 [Candidatus Nanoarchaeia archaeon]|nr:hypothetical protein [Candidatus Nanoarchaeia archaeon]
MRTGELNFKTRDLPRQHIPRAKSLAKTLEQNLGAIAKAARTKPHKLRSIRFRVYPFSRKEAANELFIKEGNKKYVCLNSALLKRKKWASLQYLLHGIGHSLCHLRDGVGEEVFCEHVGYKALNALLINKSLKERRRILRSVMRASHPEYRTYHRAARRLTESDPDKLIKLNNRAKHRKIAKINEKKVFYRALKARRSHDSEDFDDNFSVELEKGFRKL